MAVTTTTRLGLTRWSAGADPFTRAQMDASHAALEANAAMFAQGTLAARPAFGKAGRFYYVDSGASVGTHWFDTGTSWVPVSPDLSAYATTAAMTTALGGKADTAHTHAAADVTSGVFAAARLGTGTANATTILYGDGSWKAAPAGAVASLSDATVSAPSTGQVLRYNATTSKWVNATLATADVSGLDTALTGKAAASHTHVKANITDFAHTHLIADLPVATSGTSSSTQLVRADDSRLSNARTPTAHSHLIADLPVATSGTVSTTQLVRADDARLSDARTPTAHAHPITDVTGLDTFMTADVVVRRVHDGSSYPARVQGGRPRPFAVSWVGPTDPAAQAGLDVATSDDWIQTS